METGAVTANKTFAVGDYVVAYGAGPDGYQHNGQIARIMAIRENGTFSGQFLHATSASSLTLVLMDFATAEIIVDGGRRDQLTDYVKAELAISNRERAAASSDLNICRDSLARVKQSFSSAMRTISDAIWEESDVRGWCDEVVQFMERVNESLPTDYELILREREYEVETVITGTASTTHNVRVMAGSQEEADTLVKDDPDKYMDPEAILNDEYRLEWDDIEVDVR